MVKQKVISTKGDSEGLIDSLIEFLVSAKNKGATNYLMEWSGDPRWAFKWFVAYKELSDEEVKKIKIEKLEAEIRQLKNE